MKIGIDIDDTITNTKELQKVYWKEYVKNHKSDSYDEVLPSNINLFSGDKYIDEFWSIYREQLAYKTTIKDNASKIINKLRHENNKICIITARPDEQYNNLKENLRKWFKDNNIEIDELYTDIRDKGKFMVDNNIDLLIDDGYHHCKRAIELGKRAIMFNDQDNDIININNWEDIYKYINDNIKDKV